jgi:hypothetical protein
MTMRHFTTIAILMCICTIMAIILILADQFYPAFVLMFIFAILATIAEKRRAQRNRELREYLQSRHMWIDRRNESDLNALENESPER